jgi:hypothetical protein
MQTLLQSNKWYNKTWLVVLLLFCFFPMGLYGLWKSQVISKGWKIGATSFYCLLFVLAVISPSNPEAAYKSTPDETRADEVLEVKPEETPSTVKTVTDSPVNKMSSRKKHSSYTSIAEMMEDDYGYASDNGTFKIISKQPLHIQISQIVMPSMSGEEMKDMSLEGLIYITYMTFATTPIEEITITSVPMVYDGATSTNLGFFESGRYTISINKEKARQVMLRICGTSDFDDLLGYEDGNGQIMEDSPTPSFDKLKSTDTNGKVFKLLSKG